MRFAWLAASLLLALPVLAQPRVLVVSATAGFRHDSIETAEQVIAEIAEQRGVELLFARTDDDVRARMTAAELQPLTAVWFVNTSGELLASARTALLDWVRAGGTFVGFHSASDTWHDSPEYIDMLGAEFETHPPELEIPVTVVDARHPATASLPSQTVFDELYSFRHFDAARVRLLLATGSQPLAWEKPYHRGRVFYMALGHRSDLWTSPWFRAHVAGAMDWAITPPERAARRRAVRR